MANTMAYRNATQTVKSRTTSKRSVAYRFVAQNMVAKGIICRQIPLRFGWGETEMGRRVALPTNIRTRIKTHGKSKIRKNKAAR